MSEPEIMGELAVWATARTHPISPVRIMIGFGGLATHSVD
jgi:hypothetical protein